MGTGPITKSAAILPSFMFHPERQYRMKVKWARVIAKTTKELLYATAVRLGSFLNNEPAKNCFEKDKRTDRDSNIEVVFD